MNGEMLDSFYTNLEIIRRLGRHEDQILELHTGQFAFQLYGAVRCHFQPTGVCTMAYGGRGIQCFTYFAPTIGNYRLAAIDQFGNRTATWDMLRRINNQIHVLAPTLIRLRSTGVYHYPNVPDQGQPFRRQVDRGVETTQRYVLPPVAGRVLMGEFEDEARRPYFLIVNKDLKNSFQFRVRLRQDGGNWSASRHIRARKSLSDEKWTGWLPGRVFCSG